MRKRKLFLLKVCVLVGIMLLIDIKMMAGPDIKVQLRLYGGQRQAGEVKPSVTTAYYLKPLFSGTLVLDSDLKSEQREIKKIFNLKTLEMITSADWGWQAGKLDKQFEVVILNGHRFVVQLTLLKSKDTFRLDVIEKKGSKPKKILSTEVILPQKKSSVFGFEDSAGKPFFLAFERSKDSLVKAVNITRLSAKERPKLLKVVKPVYPKVALRAKIQGQVLLEANTDVYGRVVRLQVVKGHPLLTTAAVEAVRQWVYEPVIINKAPKPVSFIVRVNFSLDPKWKKKGQVKSETELELGKKGPKLIRKKKPVYPQEALKKKISGFVDLELKTDIYGRVKAARAMDGNPIFFEAALQAAKHWIYQPHIVNGTPRTVKFTVRINFDLKE